MGTVRDIRAKEFIGPGIRGLVRRQTSWRVTARAGFFGFALIAHTRGRRDVRDGEGHGLMRGIVLAGGTGSRLFSGDTPGVNKHLLPVYDKPMIYHSVAGPDAGGRAGNPGDDQGRTYIKSFKRVLGDGSALGLAIRVSPRRTSRSGIAEAFADRS